MLPATFVLGFHDEKAVRSMSYNKFRSIFISKLSLGGGAFGGCHTYGKYDLDNATKTVLEALKNGVNFIDAGPHYGHGAAETFLGNILKSVPRRAYYISTKVGRIGSYFDFSPQFVAKSFHDSLQRLQLQYVDFLFIHDVEFAPSQDLILKKTLPVVKTLLDEGRVKYIGISGYPVSFLMDLAYKSSISIDCVLSYCRNTLIDDELQHYMPQLHEKNIGVINAGCMAMRLLTNQGPPSWHPAKKETKHLCRKAAAFCSNKGVELGLLALNHAFNQDSLTCLVGMQTVQELASNLRVLRQGLNPLETSVLANLQERFFIPGKNHHWEGVELERNHKSKLL